MRSDLTQHEATVEENQNELIDALERNVGLSQKIVQHEDSLSLCQKELTAAMQQLKENVIHAQNTQSWATDAGEQLEEANQMNANARMEKLCLVAEMQELGGQVAASNKETTELIEHLSRVKVDAEQIENALREEISKLQDHITSQVLCVSCMIMQHLNIGSMRLMYDKCLITYIPQDLQLRKVQEQFAVDNENMHQFNDQCQFQLSEALEEAVQIREILELPDVPVDEMGLPESIPLVQTLQRELSVMRNKARYAEEQLQDALSDMTSQFS